MPIRDEFPGHPMEEQLDDGAIEGVSTLPGSTFGFWSEFTLTCGSGRGYPTHLLPVRTPFPWLTSTLIWLMVEKNVYAPGEHQGV